MESGIVFCFPAEWNNVGDFLSDIWHGMVVVVRFCGEAWNG